MGASPPMRPRTSIQPVSRTVEDHRREILTESVLVLANFALLIWFANKYLRLSWVPDPMLHVAISACAVILASLFLLALFMFAAKFRGERRLRTRTRRKPEIVAVMTRLAQGSGSASELARLYEEAPDAVEHVLADSLAVQKGSGYDRLVEATQACGFPERWHRLTESGSPEVRCDAITRLGLLPCIPGDRTFQTALLESEELVALEAARAMIKSGQTEEIESIFLGMSRQTRLVRALLTEWLRRHATTLGTRAIPEALRSSDEAVCVTALQTLACWRRMLLVPDLLPLLTHPTAAIRAAAFGVVPFALGLLVPDEVWHAALRAPDAGTRRAAVDAIARLRLTALASALRPLVADPDLDVACAAAAALAGLGLRKDLEKIAVSGIYPAGATATEALEKLMMGRHLA